MDTVVFIRENNERFLRTYRIAKALRSTGKYKLVCICPKRENISCDDIFDAIHYFSPAVNLRPKINRYLYRFWNPVLKIGYRKVLNLLNHHCPTIVHTMAEPYDLIAYVISKAQWPVILDAVDFSGISEGLENLPPHLRKIEKFCLENAHGICHKGPHYEIDYYRKFGYNIECPEFQWLDFCDRDFFIDSRIRKLSEIDGETHLVYTGTIAAKSDRSYCYYIPLAKQLARQKIHFHIYAHPHQYDEFREYVEFDKSEKHFHFHKPVHPEKLVKEISKYDWGVWIHPIHGRLNMPRATADKAKVAIGNKLFTYLEAGLPVLVSDHLEYGKMTIGKYSIGAVIEDNQISNIDKIISKQYYRQLQNNVRTARKKLSIQTQAKLLENFYRSLVIK